MRVRAATPADVAAGRSRGCELSVWTVDEPADIVTLADAGVDAIITNVPDVALAALAALGNDDVERVGLVLDVELLGVAHVVAVDLIREGLAAAHDEPVEIRR